MQQERRMLVLGTLTEAHTVGPAPHANQWQLLEVPSLEAAEARLSGGNNVHVGLWPYGPSYCADSFDKFSALRSRHRQMQWLALPRVRSDVTAFLEAPSIPGPGWADAHREAHLAHPEILACGGSVRIPEDAAAWELGWYWSDYSAYAPARPSGETRDLTDANVSYKSRLLRANESLLAENAWGWRIRTKSALMSYYEATAWIDYPCPHTLKIALQRRWSEGRAHGAVRARDALSILTAPVAPIVLAWRGWRGARRAGRRLSYVRALPWVLAFHVWWACGDLTGLLAGRRSRY